MIDTPTHARQLDDQYEHEAVPLAERKRPIAIGAAWAGMPMVVTAAVVGGQLAYFLGFWHGLLALVIGSAILAVYVGILSYAAGRTGRNFGQFARGVFGRTGALVPTLVLSTVVVGWYAFQTGLTGVLLSSLTGWAAAGIAIVAGVLFTALTFVGIRAISWIGYISAPLFIVFGILALVFGANAHGWSGITSYTGASSGTGALSLGAGITIVIASLVDAGTMTADFTRFSRTGREAVFATLAAFPVGQFVAAFTGILVVSAGFAIEPAVNGGMFIGLLAGAGPVWAVIAGIFVVVNLGAVCSHCLYNGAMGWSQATGASFRVVTLILGGLGCIAAGIGVWSQFSNWLNILGVIVPPIGAVVIIHVLARGTASATAQAVRMRWSAFISWALASAAALLVSLFVPSISDAVVGIVVVVVAYGIALRLVPKSQQQEALSPTEFATAKS